MGDFNLIISTAPLNVNHTNKKIAIVRLSVKHDPNTTINKTHFKHKDIHRLEGWKKLYYAVTD